ncbi:MAG: haloalkane dehalogenase [Pseudomonadota bacterium]
MVDTYRTPDERFNNLPDFPYEPNYVDDLPGFEGMRMHYVDEGSTGADRVFLCLHGEPTWCYLYRKMIPVFANSGARVIAPDLFGFGRSDKPTDDSVYSFDFHRDSLLRLIERLALSNITIVCQDWGGLIGLTLPLDIAEKVSGVLAMNTILASGELELPGSFLAWKQWVVDHPDMDAAAAMRFLDESLSEDTFDAYRAPFPNEKSKAGPRSFPHLVPISPDMDKGGASTQKRAIEWYQTQWQGDSLVACGVGDKIATLAVMQLVASWIKGAPAVMEVPEAGHFCQEHGAAVAEKYLALYPA